MLSLQQYLLGLCLLGNIVTVEGAFKMMFLDKKDKNLTSSRTVSVKTISKTNIPNSGKLHWYYNNAAGITVHDLGTSTFERYYKDEYRSEKWLMVLEEPSLVGVQLQIHVRWGLTNDTIDSEFSVRIPAPWNITTNTTPIVGEAFEVLCSIPNSFGVEGIEWRRRVRKDKFEGNVRLGKACQASDNIIQEGYSVMCDRQGNMTDVRLIIPDQADIKSLNGSYWRCVEFNKKLGSSFLMLQMTVPILYTVIANNSNGPQYNGQLLNFTCDVNDDAKPPVNIEWLLSDNEVLGSDSRNLCTSMPQSICLPNNTRSFLTVLMKGQNDKKYLFCKATSPYGRKSIISKPVKLEVLHPPYGNIQITGYTPSRALRANDSNETVVCEIEGGNPVPSMKFYCSDNRKSTCSPYQNDLVTMCALTVTLNALLNNVRCICEVTHSLEKFKRNTSFNFNVIYAPIVNVNNVAEREGEQNVTLMCKVNANPDQITVRWRHEVNGVQIQNNQELQRFLTNRNTTLVIRHLTVDDGGTYVCSVRNEVPNAQGEIWQQARGDITVLGKPYFPNKHLSFIGNIGTDISIAVPFYASPVIDKADVFIRNLNNSNLLKNSSTLMIDLERMNITMSYYGKDVIQKGQAVVLKISQLSDDLIGEYNIILCKGSWRQSISTFSIRVSSDQDPQTEIWSNSLLDVVKTVGSILFLVLIVTIFFVVCYIKRTKKKDDANTMGKQEKLGIEEQGPSSLQPGIQIQNGENELNTIADNAHLWRRGRCLYEQEIHHDALLGNMYNTIQEVGYAGLNLETMN